ncbi:hypothetical protein VTN02DRAFT_3357 [Thermoascus thermophilus]
MPSPREKRKSAEARATVQRRKAHVTRAASDPFAAGRAADPRARRTLGPWSGRLERRLERRLETPGDAGTKAANEGLDGPRGRR